MFRKALSKAAHECSMLRNPNGGPNLGSIETCNERGRAGIRTTHNFTEMLIMIAVVMTLPDHLINRGS